MSWGFNDTVKGNGYISVRRNTVSKKITNERGFNIVELNVRKCSISDVHTLDTYDSSARIVTNYITNLPTLTVLIGVTADEASNNLEINLKNALLSIGVNVTGLEYRGKVAFVAQVGRPALTVMKMSPRFGDSVKITVNVQGNVNTYFRG